MKYYKYKIQWILKVSSTSDITDTFRIIKALGHRSFDAINYMTEDLKIVGSVSHIMYAHEDVKKLLTKIRKDLKENEKITYIELYRK